MQRETSTLEFKSAVNKGFLKTVSAFANFGGGKIVFGVDDNGAPVGLDDPRQACLDIENRINDAISPRPAFLLEIVEEDGTVELTVEEGLDKPYLAGGKAYRRSDSSTVEVDKIELRRLVLEGQNLDYDEMPSSATNLTFCTLEARLSASLGIASLTDDIMKTLGLFNGDVPTNAATLLSDSNTFPGVDMAKFGKDQDTILDRETVQRVSVLEQFDRTMAFFNRYCVYEMIDGAERIKVERVPQKAFREALANALAHRTWDVAASVRVSVTGEGVEIVSPGGLAPGMTASAYLEGQYSLLRNPVLAECLFRAGIIEKFGTGVRRIRNAYEGSGVSPCFEVRDSSITVKLPYIDGNQALTPDECEVLDAVPRNMLVSRSAVSKAIGFEKTKTVRNLKSLVEKGYLRSQGEGRARRYARAAM